ncbi:hypothetical protein U2060_15185, partial [Listeria monocytogenes]|uniref:hypothetical protein n=1 Tax=Listeria monocytogenes TaxID=1639 RepID=UPI002FDBEEB1
NDAINDTYNIIHQTAQKGIPVNLYDPSILSPSAMKQMAASPADWFPALPDVSGRLSNAVWSSTPSMMHPATIQLFDLSKGSIQE